MSIIIGAILFGAVVLFILLRGFNAIGGLKPSWESLKTKTPKDPYRDSALGDIRVENGTRRAPIQQGKTRLLLKFILLALDVIYLLIFLVILVKVIFS